MGQLKIGLLTIITIFANTITFGQSANSRVRSALKLNFEEAEIFLESLEIRIRDIQTAFTDIGSTELPVSTRRAKIPWVINRNFRSKRSIIQVSSFYRPVSEYAAIEYFDRIVRLSTSGKYARVELLWDPDFLKLGVIEKINNNTYEFSVSMDQIFRGYGYDGKIKYEDVTKKDFRFRCTRNNGYWDFKIDMVMAFEPRQPRRSKF